MSKHTPGPWKYDAENSGSVVSYSGKWVADVSDRDGNLIAAAPIMYELLKHMAEKSDIMWQRDYHKRMTELFNQVEQP